MKTEYRLSEALKEMMEKTPLDEISVVALTKKCDINRQTFYYHFHDIYDLLTLVFLNEKIRNIDKAKKLNEMVVAIYQYYEENALFIEAAINSAGKELFQEFIYNNCFQVILRFVNESQNNKKLLTSDRRSIARFYALGYAHSIVYYLSVFKNKSLQGLMSCFCFEKDENLAIAINNYIEYKGMNGNDRF